MESGATETTERGKAGVVCVCIRKKGLQWVECRNGQFVLYVGAKRDRLQARKSALAVVRMVRMRVEHGELQGRPSVIVSAIRCDNVLYLVDRAVIVIGDHPLKVQAIPILRVLVPEARQQALIPSIEL